MGWEGRGEGMGGWGKVDAWEGEWVDEEGRNEKPSFQSF